jgi:hypothetical protein
VADAACALLESRGIRCWIAPRDVTPGVDWSAEIIDAIHASRVMVLVYSSGANESPQIKRELERAVAKGIPIVPFRIEDVPMSKALEYFISSPHWLDALTPPLERHLDYLAQTVRLLLSRPGPDARSDSAPGQRSSVPAAAAGLRPTTPSAAPQAASTPSTGSRIRGSWIALAVVAAVAIGGYAVASRGRGVDSDLVGHWGFQTNNQTGSWQSTFVVARNGGYRIETQVHDHGRVTASGDRFQMVSSTGTRVSGTFRALDPTSVEVTSAVGTVTWKREAQSSDAPAGPMVGTWDATFVVAGATWNQTIINAPDGGYTLTSATADSGWITASAGNWHMTSRGGQQTDGTYHLINPQTLSFTGPLGASVWTKGGGG